jgi:hypothetical protein
MSPVKCGKHISFWAGPSNLIYIMNKYSEHTYLFTFIYKHVYCSVSFILVLLQTELFFELLLVCSDTV